MKLKITTTKEIPLYMARDKNGIAVSLEKGIPLIMSDANLLVAHLVQDDFKRLHEGDPVDWDSVKVVKLGKR